jgi:hypothetical protein
VAWEAASAGDRARRGVDILEALADIKAWTYEILELVRDEDEEEEDA